MVFKTETKDRLLWAGAFLLVALMWYLGLLYLGMREISLTAPVVIVMLLLLSRIPEKYWWLQPLIVGIAAGMLFFIVRGQLTPLISPSPEEAKVLGIVVLVALAVGMCIGGAIVGAIGAIVVGAIVGAIVVGTIGLILGAMLGEAIGGRILGAIGAIEGAILDEGEAIVIGAILGAMGGTILGAIGERSSLVQNPAFSPFWMLVMALALFFGLSFISKARKKRNRSPIPFFPFTASYPILLLVLSAALFPILFFPLVKGVALFSAPVCLALCFLLSGFFYTIPFVTCALTDRPYRFFLKGSEIEKSQRALVASYPHLFCLTHFTRAQRERMSLFYHRVFCISQPCDNKWLYKARTIVGVMPPRGPGLTARRATGSM